MDPTATLSPLTSARPGILRVASLGMLTSIQDAGRFGFRDQGVPPGGAMDRRLALLANACAGNPAEDPVLEFTVVGPELWCLSEITLVLAAVGFSAKVDGRPVPTLQPFQLREGERLRIGAGTWTLRGYLAAKGGWDVPSVFGSASMLAPLTPGLALAKGTLLRGGTGVPEQPGREGIAAVEADLSYLQDAFLDAWPGPEWESLPESMRAALLATTFTIHPDSNRMAVLLDHDSGLTAPEILTGPVEPGTIQLTPSGRTIVLMRDAQTTGGYARILQLGERAISALAQRRPRSAVRIRLHPGRPWEARTGP